MRQRFVLGNFLTFLVAMVVCSAELPAAELQSGAEGGAGQEVRAARRVAEDAARALGGLDKIQGVRNITLFGYGTYPYDFGGGAISGSPDAPEKLIAANELRRVYDLENDRFQLEERHYWLFPFLQKSGHSWQKTKINLDGDIAWNSSGTVPRRLARWEDNVNWTNGPVMQRMWMMNNPAVLVRTMLDPGTRLSEPRVEGDEIEIDITLKQGYRLTAGFGVDHLPTSVMWAAPHTNLGQVNFTTRFSGWSDVEGFLMPLGYQTRIDWRDVRYLNLFVDSYEIDGEIENLAVPSAVAEVPEPVAFPPLTITSEPIGRGLWRLSNGTTVVEFADHLLLYDLTTNGRQAKQMLDYARSLAPGKPIRYLVTSHTHFTHLRGLRTAVAEGITIISRPVGGQLFAELVNRPAPEYPDELSHNPQVLKFLPLEDHLRLQDSYQTLDLYWVRMNAHMADGIFGYVPEQKVLMEGDMATAASEFQHWPDNLREMVNRYKLDVQIVSPVDDTELGNRVHTIEEIETLLREGTRRAREHCEARRVAGDYHPGCPIRSRYY